ncbi:MAG: hypothetical protein DJ555_05295 [Desulfurococcaceae archaeon]|jgi:manganese transport protein|nr:MAG: hypothetical protein DJ555_05295 [Desulfurococcaceae archaeon]
MGRGRSILRASVILGPATVVSVAYIDPGNFGSNIAAGSKYGLNLLWVVWVAGLLAILFQYLSGKIGIATSRSTVDLVSSAIKERLSGPCRSATLALYFSSLIAVILATDMAEFLGIVLGLSFLLGLPIEIAIWISVVDVLILMMITDRRLGFETLIGSLVGVVGISFLYELVIVGIDPKEILVSSVMPREFGGEHTLLAISIIGATVMPHALILHPYLTAEKWGTARSNEKLKRHMLETIAYLSIASVMNAAIQIMAYYAFYRNGYHDVDMDIAHAILEPLYGSLSAVVFAIAMLASGISSSMVSVLAGQKVVESLVGKRLEAWKLRLMVRLANMLPLAIAIHAGVKPIDVLVYSQAVLSLVLPVVIIPITIYARSKSTMGSMVNSRVIDIAAIIGTIVIVTFNLGFIVSSLLNL